MTTELGFIMEKSIYDTMEKTMFICNNKKLWHYGKINYGTIPKTIVL